MVRNSSISELNLLIESIAADILKDETARIQQITDDVKKNTEELKLKELKKLKALDLVLSYLKLESYTKGKQWLEKVLEIGDGNYLGFIVLSKQDFEEEHTGFKKLLASWDTKQETDSKMTKAEKELIAKVNSKKDNLEKTLEDYVKNWDSEIYRDCYKNGNQDGILGQQNTQTCQKTLRSYKGEKQIFKIKDEKLSIPGDVRYHENLGYSVTFGESSFYYSSSVSEKGKEISSNRRVLFKVGFVMPADI